MKILHLIIGLGNGGAENTLLKLCLIKNKKYTHEVISLTKNKEILSNFRKKKIKVHFLNFKKTRLNFFQILKLFKILKKKNPSFIFCWMYHACFVSIFIKYLFRKKFSFVWLIRHGSFHLKFTKITTIFLKYILKKFSSTPRAILYCSNFSKKIHNKYGFVNKKSKIIQNGVDINKFNFNLNARKQLRKRFKISNKYFVIGIVGRYHPQKNHIQLLRVLQDKKLYNEKIVIILVGKNVINIKAKISKNKNHKFIFINERKDINRIYSMFDLNLSLSTFGESFPNVIIESMACRIPTIASNISDNKIIINNEKMIFKVNNDYDLIVKIKILIHKFRNKNMKYFNASLRERVIKFYSLKKMIKDYELFLKNI